MNTFILRLLSLTLLLAVPGLAAAQNGDNGDVDDDGELGVTMTVVEGQGAIDEEDFFNEIELPEVVPEQATSSAESGLDAASQSRREGLDLGQERAEEGRSRGNAGNPPVDTPAP